MPPSPDNSKPFLSSFALLRRLKLVSNSPVGWYATFTNFFLALGQNLQSKRRSNEQWVITIRDLVIACSIGILEQEKNKKQPVCISIKCYATLTRSLEGKLHYICYDELLTKVKNFIESGHIELVENLAETICQICFTYPSVERVFVSVEKTAVYPDGARVGVEIDRTR